MSTVSPTSSSAESSSDTLLIDFSFSTGGGAGTSILDAAITAGRPLELSSESSRAGGLAGFFNGAASSNAEGWSSDAEERTAAGVGAGGDAGEVGGNLNSLFIDPFLLFLCSAFMCCT